MNSAAAIFIKQFQDILKNSGVMIQFIMYPAMAFLMTKVIDVPGAQDSLFITMFAAMFVGMGVTSSIATAIAEDRERNSLRFLLMAGVKSHEYLLGIGGVFFTASLFTCSLFVAMMSGISIINSLIMLASMMMGVAASILFGAIIGMLCKNEQEAISISSVAGMILGMGPMIANFSGNATLERIFGIFYTMNFVYDNFRTIGAVQRFGIIFANVMALAAVFSWVYGKQETRRKGVIVMNKKIIVALLIVALLGGSGIGFAVWHNAGFLATDNARVTTTLIPVSVSVPGRLERFPIFEGCYVKENDIIGWVENNEPIRSPVSGIVIKTNAVQNQMVSPAEPLTVIADTSRIHIRANIDETDILKVQSGQPAIVTIDALGKQKINGFVSEIGKITHAEITGNPLFFNIDGNFSRLTHSIPVEITIVDDINLTHLIGVNARARLPLRKLPGDFQFQTADLVNGTSVNRTTVSSTVRRNVYTALGAIVKQVNVALGDIVNEGQILGLMDNGDLTNNVNIAEASLRIAEVNLSEAEHNHEILASLYGARAVPLNDLRQSEFTLQTAIAARKQAQAALDSAFIALQQSVIRAPINGKVTAVFAKEGEFAMGRLFIIEDENNVRIHCCSFLPCR